MVIVVVCGALIVSPYLPICPAANAREIRQAGDRPVLLIVAYGLIGVFTLYALGLLLLVVAYGRELKDKRTIWRPRGARGESRQKREKIRAGRRRQQPNSKTTLQA